MGGDEERPAGAFDCFTAADWAAKHTVVSEADFAVNPLRNRRSVLLSRAAHVSYHLDQAVLAPKQVADA